MRIALLGATGRTGSLVLADALDRGHQVSALVRRSGAVPEQGGLDIVIGDATDPTALRQLTAGTDAVLSALGPRATRQEDRRSTQPNLHTTVAQALVEQLSADGPRRFVGISGAGIDVAGDDKRFKDRVISWVIQRVGGEAVRDRPREYAVWAASDLDWTLVRVPRLVDGPATGRLEQDAHRSARSTSLARADLAEFLLDAIEQDLYPRLAPFIATARR